jgi:hypothetical protein
MCDPPCTREVSNEELGGAREKIRPTNCHSLHEIGTTPVTRPAERSGVRSADQEERRVQMSNQGSGAEKCEGPPFGHPVRCLHDVDLHTEADELEVARDRTFDSHGSRRD